MADVKISALPAASTPLAGTEVLPIVQGGTTDKVSVANLTAGRTVDAAAVVVGAGNVSAPSITFTGDTNTGIYSPAADTIAFAEGGTEVMRIDASGNVGIGLVPNSGQGTLQSFRSIAGGAPVTSGTSDPNQVAMFAAGGVQLSYGALASGSGWLQMRASANFATNYDLLLQPNGGNVGIGTSSPARRLDIQQSGTNYQLRIGDAGGSNFYDIGRDTSNGLLTFYGSQSVASGYVFSTVNGERARITSGGDWLVAKTTNADTTVGSAMLTNGRVTSTMAASGTSETSYHLYSTGAGAYRFYVNLAGTVFATSTAIVAISDKRLKENIRDLDTGLAEVMALKPRKFDWRPGKGKDKKDDQGWIAQEFEQVFPNMIAEWKDPAPEGEEPYKAVSADLIPVLVKAIQQQQAQIEELKARVAALEAK